MVYILHTPAARATADRLRADLQNAGQAIDSAQSTTRTQVVIALLEANSETDPSFMQGLLRALDSSQHLRALDSSQHLLPVLVEDAPLPKVIEHLGALDFTDGYDPKAIQQWLSHQRTGRTPSHAGADAATAEPQPADWPGIGRCGYFLVCGRVDPGGCVSDPGPARRIQQPGYTGRRHGGCCAGSLPPEQHALPPEQHAGCDRLPGDGAGRTDCCPPTAGPDRYRPGRRVDGNRSANPDPIPDCALTWFTG